MTGLPEDGVLKTRRSPEYVFGRHCLEDAERLGSDLIKQEEQAFIGHIWNSSNGRGGCCYSSALTTESQEGFTVFLDESRLAEPLPILGIDVDREAGDVPDAPRA